MISKRIILSAISVILLCMTVIVGVTFALFSDQKTVKHHLKAGDLSITLTRTELTKTSLNEKGNLVTETVQSQADAPVDFSNSTDKTVFDITGEEKIVPGSKFSATMKIENLSDVAFGYWIEIVCVDKSNGEDLAKQLKVTVTTEKESSAFVGDGLNVRGDNGDYVSKLEIGDSESFCVTVEFLNSADTSAETSDNDLAQSESLYFDLVVHAVQFVS